MYNSIYNLPSFFYSAATGIGNISERICNSIYYSLNNISRRVSRSRRNSYGGRRNSDTHIFRGLVTSLNPVGRYRTTLQKISDALFLGIPYTIGFSAYSLRFRVEKIDDYGRYTDDIRDFVFFGDLEGVIQLGSEVSVRSDSSGRVKSVLVHDTGREYRPASALSVVLIRVAAILAVALFIMFIVSVVNGTLFAFLGAFFGGIFSAFGMMLMYLMPYAVCFMIVYYIFRGIFS
ncbi:MAG: hypothetical protein E7218_01750 [Anaerofustis stercorihominis]|nr:hypothetical protein [Anaerofustis stercorihominis]